MKKIFIALVSLSLLTNCTPNDKDIDLNAIGAPENISALMTIAQDNSGKVTITPRGQGVTQYEVYFGDTTTEPAFVAPGESVTHVYSEGLFQVKIVGTTLNGKRTEISQELTVTFITPTNLHAIVNPVVGDNLSITVSATANLETFFQVFFGDVVNEVPVAFNDGETISHTYAAEGTYTVTVRALSGGAAYAEEQYTVEIINPVLLPIDFESSTLNYEFVNFGNANSSVVNNPYINATNGSTKVAKMTKSSGADTWAGSYLTVGNPIDFSVMKKIKMKVYSPQAGIVIKMKVENATDATIFKESDVTLTTANSWQELTFDFTGINTANTYQKIVVFFNFGNPGVGLSYYFDDIQQTTGAEALALPLTFQSTTLNYTFINFGSATTTVVNNPQTTGINTSTKVGKFDKVNGAQTWAGSSILMDGPINFAVQKKLKMKVWSPAVGKTVKLKLEILNAGNPDPTNIERDATTTVANAWEELTFDFNGINNANNYRRVVVFFDFGSTAASTFYFDDIIQAN
jgi:hypothetical protein